MTSSSSSSSSSSSISLPPIVGRLDRKEHTPICVLVVGMAGSGKTTLLAQMQQSLEQQQQQQQRKEGETTTSKTTETHDVDSDNRSDDDDDSDDDEYNVNYYCLNLDPAVLTLDYDVHLDIRDTVHYQNVMQHHQLGPNGAIMTSLNLFCTKFDQVLQILEQKAYYSSPTTTTQSTTETDNNNNQNHNHKLDYILVDTPGQIEAFTWSASGTIISESLASSFPTVLCFVIDTVRCASSPNTFMSNMLYACSMLYRTRLPLVVCFNKADVVSPDFCTEWMNDPEVFQQALDDHSATSGFYGSLTRSLSLVLEEFYSHFANACAVSAVTGEGMDDFWKTVQKAARDDFLDYVQDVKFRVEENEALAKAKAKVDVQRLQRDLDTTT